MLRVVLEGFIEGEDTVNEEVLGSSDRSRLMGKGRHRMEIEIEGEIILVYWER